MRLGFDASGVRATGKGVSRFQTEFLRTVAELRLVGDLTVFVPEDADQEGLPAVPAWRYRRVRTRPMALWEQVGMPQAARRERLDLVITTSERPAAWGPRQVVYLYEHPRHRARRHRAAGAPLRQRLADTSTVALFPILMRRPAVVLAASRATAADIAPIRSARVVPSGVSRDFTPDRDAAERMRQALGLPDGYLLHVGSDDPRDNSEVVLDAVARLADLGRRPPLVVGGPVNARLPALRERARELGLEDRVHWLGFRSGSELVDLYRGAIAYVDPSLHEGFGLQVLEAMACGVPPVTSNRSSLPEVVGDAGILLDPFDVEGFASALRSLLEDADLRAETGRRAAARAGEFTWERTVREVLAACEAAAQVPATPS